MKKHYFFIAFLLCYSLLPAQVQIGQDIDGEASGDRAGESISISADGSIVAIGAPQNNVDGHVRIYENQGGTWIQIGQDIDSDGFNDFFGSTVSLSADGTIVAIGAADHDIGSLSLVGEVRVFENQNGNWVQLGQNIEGDAAGDKFGISVSINANGTILAIGVRGYDGVNMNSGLVRVYENQGGTWTQIGQDIEGETNANFFGESLSISADGTIVAAGSIRNDDNGLDSGHVRVYENQGGTWVQIGQDIDGEATDDFSGFSVSLSADGAIVAIGAPLNDGNGLNSGHVRVYENQNSSWVQLGQDIEGSAESDIFGYSTSLNDNGNILAIGSTGNDGNGDGSGEVRIFSNQGGDWVQIGIDLNGEAQGDRFGLSVSLNGDGSILAVGAPINLGANNNFSGHTRVFDLNAVLSNQEQELITFSLHPNPAKTEFSVEIPRNSILQNINIYSITGQLVKISKNNTVDISKLASGLYTIEIETDKGKNTKKLLIN